MEGGTGNDYPAAHLHSVFPNGCDATTYITQDGGASIGHHETTPLGDLNIGPVCRGSPLVTVFKDLYDVFTDRIRRAIILASNSNGYVPENSVCKLQVVSDKTTTVNVRGHQNYSQTTIRVNSINL